MASKFKDFEQLSQRGGFRKVKTRYNAWKTRWDNGKNWGIVGGTGAKSLPETVLDEVLMHGEADYARDAARNIEGLGLLLESITEILDGDIITEDDKNQLRLDIDRMEAVLKQQKWNPRNIPFHTIIRFTEGGEGEAPTIERGKMYGHYRTPAYNKYTRWAIKNKEGFTGKLATTKKKWSNKKKGQAEPPLWQAISGESEHGILSIAREALKATEGVTLCDDTVINIYATNKKDVKQLAQIQSVREKVTEALNNRNLYNTGANQKHMTKDKLNQFLSMQTYAIQTEEIDLLNFVKGWNEVVGVENLTSIRLYFPPNNKSINALIREVLGDEINTFETPNAKDGISKPGLTLKAVKPKNWQEILGVK